MSVVSFAAAQLIRVLPRSAISKALGTLCEASLPRPLADAVVSTYCRAYRVATHEADPSGMPYRSFDAFFTRKLRHGLRTVEGDPRTLVSPADGRLSELGRIEPHGAIRVKAQDYTLEELIGDRAWARELCGGGFGVVYLSPRDYHRVHAPVDGEIVRVRGIEGDRWPVNALGERYVPGLFVRNRRVVVEIRSPAFGRVAVVFVGAMIVGRMTVVGIDQPDVRGDHVVSPARTIARGDELGAFHLGSTVVFAVGPGAFDRFTRGTGEVSYGQSVARATERAS
ncbi:MAG: archaetidylserine decarboxylase [Polyangiales bacterium]